MWRGCWACQRRDRRERRERRERYGVPTVPGVHGVASGLRRCCFVLARRSFISRIFRFSARGRGERRRRSFSFSAIRRLLASASLCSNNSINRRTAMVRFWCCERESLTVTDNPVGTCRKVTAVDTLLTFWPPGPPDRAKNSANCDSLNPSR
jgi:hypothetical protein